MMKILLTGGGTAGHVNPNLALVPYLREAGFDIEYIGSYDGIEKQLIEDAGIPYQGISSGKLRRYLDIRNITDPVRILKGIREAKSYIKKSRPDVVFSKGGFVAVPVVIAASDCRIPVVIHESDLSPGLANKLAIPRAKKVCYSFPETKQYLSADKAVHTGLPVRENILQGSKEEGIKLCSFTGERPVLLVIGGSLGSAAVNDAVRSSLKELLNDFCIIHVCGKGKLDESLYGVGGYVQMEYAADELAHFFAASDVVVSRAGANAVCELLALKKPALLIPLGTKASRGDQILNAESFRKRGYADVLHESDIDAASFAEKVKEVYSNRERFITAMSKDKQEDPCRMVMDVIMSVLS